MSPNGDIRYPVNFGFTIVALDEPVYISKNATKAVEPIVSAGTTFEIGYLDSVNGPTTGDTAYYYYITPGMNRSFNYSGVISNTGGAGVRSVSIFSINYGLSATDLSSEQIYDGLEDLHATVMY